MPDESSRVAGVKTGNLDIAYGLTASSADAVQGRLATSRSSRTKGTGLGYCMMYDNKFPDQDSPLKDVDVRKALLDGRRPRLASPRRCTAATPRTPTARSRASRPGYDPDTKPLPYDPDAAKKMLADAGHVRPVADAQHVQGDVDDAGHPEADRDDRLVLEGDRRRRRRSTSPTPATYLPQWRDKQLHGAGDDRRADELLHRAEPPGASSFFSTNAAVHDGRQRPRDRRLRRPAQRRSSTPTSATSSARQLGDLPRRADVRHCR